MLGRLATWLRVLGCDVEYHRQIEDGDLVARARETGRIILTRDRRLVIRRHARDNSFLVASDDFRVQLREVTRHFDIRPAGGFLTRCLRCNCVTEAVEPGEVKEEVPPYVFKTLKSFRRCGDCGRVYWGGTHRERMRRELEGLAGESEGD